METALKRLYEGMFLIDSAQASDWDGVVKTIKKLLDRSEAEIVTIRNWAEKKLAYEIDHKSRGTYVLCYFKADAGKIGNIEKDVQLSEQIMRVLILGTETRDKADVERDMHGLTEEKEKPKTDEATAEQLSSEEKAVEVSKPSQSAEAAAADVTEPEQPDEPEVADVIEPEQPAEPAAADAIEPEKPAESAAVDVIESEKPVEPTSVDAIEPDQPAEPAAADAIEPEKSAEPEAADAIEPEKPAEPEAADATEPEQPETEQEPKKREKKRFFNW